MTSGTYRSTLGRQSALYAMQAAELQARQLLVEWQQWNWTDVNTALSRWHAAEAAEQMQCMIVPGMYLDADSLDC